MTPDHRELYYEEARKSACDCTGCSHDQIEKKGPGRKKKTVIKTEVVGRMPKRTEELKYGGYVPPFRQFSAGLKRRPKPEPPASLPGFQTFMDSFDQVVPQNTYMSVLVSDDTDPLDKSPAAKALGLGNSFTVNKHSPASTGKAQNKVHTPASDTSLRTNTSGCSFPDTTPDSEILAGQQSESMKPYARKGQKRIWLESYNNNRLEEEEERRRGLDGGEEDWSGYVLIPCEAAVAQEMGWPLHLLQRVSNATLDRLKMEMNISSDSDQQPAGCVPDIEAKTVLSPQLQPSGDNITHADDMETPSCSRRTLSSTLDNMATDSVETASHNHVDTTFYDYRPGSFNSAGLPCDNMTTFGDNRTPSCYKVVPPCSITAPQRDQTAASHGNIEIASKNLADLCDNLSTLCEKKTLTDTVRALYDKATSYDKARPYNIATSYDNMATTHNIPTPFNMIKTPCDNMVTYDSMATAYSVRAPSNNTMAIPCDSMPTYTIRSPCDNKPTPFNL